MTRAHYTAACAAFADAGWILERHSRGPRYALPGTPWRGRVGDLYVMLYQLEGRYADDRHYYDPRALARITTALAQCARQQRRALARHRPDATKGETP